MNEASPIHLFDLASGGMGEVSLVVRRAEGFERLYALKRLRARTADDPEIRRMFVAEARLAGMLRHPNVVSVLDVGADEDGAYLVMEWVDGAPLDKLIPALLKEGPIPVGLACQVIRQVARGLHAAHELRTHHGEALPLVHRDVSPANILVGYDGLVRVTDFGIAKALGGNQTTGAGVLKGKFGYMSPEQLRFDAIDRRSDLFALGVVFYEMLAGRRLYGGSGVAVEQTARAILRDPPPSIGEERRDVPRAVEELLFELLAKRPEHRPATAREVADRLDALGRDLDEELVLADYVGERLAETRAAMTDRIATAMAHARAQALVEQPKTPARLGLALRKGWAVWTVAALVPLGLGWWWLAGPEPADDPAAATPVVNLARPAEEEPSPVPAPTDGTGDSPTGPPETAPGDEATSDRAAEVEPSPAPMRARPRRPRRRAIPRPGEGGWN